MLRQILARIRGEESQEAIGEPYKRHTWGFKTVVTWQSPPVMTPAQWNAQAGFWTEKR